MTTVALILIFIALVTVLGLLISQSVDPRDGKNENWVRHEKAPDEASKKLANSLEEDMFGDPYEKVTSLSEQVGAKKEFFNSPSPLPITNSSDINSSNIEGFPFYKNLVGIDAAFWEPDEKPKKAKKSKKKLKKSKKKLKKKKK